MAKYEIGGESFSSKAAIQKRCSSILNTAKTFPAEVPPKDTSFVVGLLRMHKTVEEKIGCGLERVYIDRNEYGGRGFWLERTDGTRTDWGIASCLTPSTHREDVIGALRYLVTEQVIEFRDKAFAGKATVQCAITGKPVDKNTSHVDHAPPNTFIAIAENFLRDLGSARKCEFSWADIKLRPSRDGDTHSSLVDPEMEEAWLWYHKTYSMLRITEAKANLSQGARQGARRP